MKLRSVSGYKQGGLSLVGFIFVIAGLALLAVLAMKVVPSIVEYNAIKKAIVAAKATGATTAREIQIAFDKQREAGYIESVSSKDLIITKTADGIEIDVAYQKTVGLFGPVSLVIDYAASTDDTPAKEVE